jgi:hypothetical protein
MSQSLIDRVVCDKCGEVREFEKIDRTGKRVRLESLTEWLLRLGWYVDAVGLQTADVCPQCYAVFRGREHGGKET